MCKYLGNQLCQLHWRIPLSLIEEGRQSMAQHLTQQPAVEMPAIFGPHSLDLVSVHQLPKGGVDAIPDSADHGTTLGPRVSSGSAKGRFQLEVSLLQFFPEGRIPVVTVSQQQAPGTHRQLRNYRSFRNVGRCDVKLGDHTRPATADMHSKAVEGLTCQGIPAKGRLPFEPATPM